MAIIRYGAGKITDQISIEEKSGRRVVSSKQITEVADGEPNLQVPNRSRVIDSPPIGKS